MSSASILSIATALPPFTVSQSEAKSAAKAMFRGRSALFDRLAGVFDNALIDRRHTVAPIDWYRQPHGWAERTTLYVEATEALFLEAAAKAIDDAGITPGQIDGLVFVSTTGISTPSIDARVAPRLGLRPDVHRVPLFGLGCAGGVSGLATAARLAAAEPGTHWLFVTVETCSISIRLDSDDPAAIVATALFGDGAAAVVLSTKGPAIARVAGAGEKLWPDTLGIMGWRVEDPGLAVIFDRAIPPFIETELADAVDEIVTGLGLSRSDIDRFCCHPGGAKVVDAIETALGLAPQSLDLEREVLRDYGNMSAPTILFVLDRLVTQGLPQRVMMTAFGPGFTCAGLLLERA
ncbi:MAG TPA: 3-oxoacyl-[acyl-carrier-protein] synthase III C-terminal domain-containing protein [Sphingomicrobium sp.]|nr:3-oxoacyl-[acyl-carrier-protein] synthase III C-terminal domain-containing protein [Sphingomicrobium sp.]